jgi:hypothetical protein
MKKQFISMTMVLALSAGFQAQADVDLDGVTMNITTEEVKRGQTINFQLRDIIQNFQLENSDITQEEIDANVTERQANREEMKALKASGDTVALEAKLIELKAQHQQRRSAMKEYINNNEDLKTAIQAQREEIRALQRERKEERKARREGRKPGGE